MDFFTYSVLETYGVLKMTIGVLVIMFCYYLFDLLNTKQKKLKLPPLVNLPFYDILKVFIRGRFHRFIYICAEELGPVFRIRQFCFRDVYIVCDPKIAHLILEGSNDMPEGEKANSIKVIDRLTNGTRSILTRKTHGEEWQKVRKNLSPAFSMTSLLKRLPDIQMKCMEFEAILDEHIKNDEPLCDLSQWMTRLTMDFISTAMFRMDFNTLSDDDETSIGHIYLKQFPAAARELIVLQRNFFRRLQFWSKENKVAHEAANKIEEVSKDVLGNYRARYGSNGKDESESQTDDTIIGRIVRGPYKTDHERLSDITILLSAGNIFWWFSSNISSVALSLFFCFSSTHTHKHSHHLLPSSSFPPPSTSSLPPMLLQTLPMFLPNLGHDTTANQVSWNCVNIR